DVWLTPIQMKKTRPGTIITVLCSPGNAGTFKRILLEETSTFGLRTVTVMKKAIEREIIDVATSWGHVGVKVGREGSRVTSVSPEFSDCARIAGEHGVPIKEVFQEAQSLARDKLDPTPGGD
ncbi:MAG: LarC family nickel insertion protein, partial [Actinobacteria bacterium]|nr:LarC family nickel insertion protein [Actinomycetota bacterium]